MKNKHFFIIVVALFGVSIFTILSGERLVEKCIEKIEKIKKESNKVTVVKQQSEVIKEKKEVINDGRPIIRTYTFLAILFTVGIVVIIYYSLYMIWKYVVYYHKTERKRSNSKLLYIKEYFSLMKLDKSDVGISQMDNAISFADNLISESVYSPNDQVRNHYNLTILLFGVFAFFVLLSGIYRFKIGDKMSTYGDWFSILSPLIFGILAVVSSFWKKGDLRQKRIDKSEIFSLIFEEEEISDVKLKSSAKKRKISEKTLEEILAELIIEGKVKRTTDTNGNKFYSIRNTESGTKSIS